MTSTSPHYRPHLDGVRAVAVVLVILFHLGYRWVPGGFVGVDVFFVMSGYLITGLLLGEAARSGGVGLRRFYARRMRRLLPASALVLLAVMALSAWLFDAIGKQSVGHDASAAALYVANWRFITSGADYFTPGDIPSPLVHFWSLAVEEQFYLVWPALFLLLWRLSTRRKGPSATGGLLAAVLVLGAASAVASVVLVPSTAAYYGTHTRAYQLLAGAALAIVATRFRPRLPTGPAVRWGAGAVVVASFAGLFTLSHRIADATNYPGTAALAVTAVALVLIAALDLAPAGPVSAVVGHPVLAFVGRLSYSLYLWHWPIIVFTPLLAERWHRPGLAGKPAQVALMAAAALGSYFLVERPVRFRLWMPAPAGAVIAVALSVSVLVSVVGIPVLQPRNPFAVRALAAVNDLAPPGPCPYFREQWGPPSRSEPCVYRKGGRFTVALVGDSHAQQWQPAFDVLAQKYDLTIIRVTRRGCPANSITVFALDDQGLPHADVSCTRWRDRVYAHLVQRYDPDLIYVETRSHEWGIRDGARDVEAGTPEQLALWTAGWTKTLDTLQAGHGQVVVGETTPNIRWRVPACLAEHGKGTKACDMPLADDPGVRPFNAVIRALPSRFPGVKVVDATPIICPDGMCPAMLDGQIVHRDDDHLSASFARAAAPAFEAMLLDAGVRLR